MVVRFVKILKWLVYVFVYSRYVFLGVGIAIGIAIGITIGFGVLNTSATDLESELEGPSEFSTTMPQPSAEDVSESDQNISEDEEFVYAQEILPLIRIHSPEDVYQLRKSLIDFIWKDGEFTDSKLPTSVEENISDERFSELNNLKQIDKLVIEFEHGVNSIVYHFIPESENGKILVYHQGHKGDFINGIDTISLFLDNNYHVIALAMPLYGLNSQPIVELDRFRSIKLSGHDHFRFLDSTGTFSFKFFVEPIRITLNYLDLNYDFEEYYMAGPSGGGFLAAFYPAIDERISQSYGVAGSAPVYIESLEIRPWHYEYLIWLDKANYLEIYVMAAFGENRKFVQIFNEFDSCCYDGDSFEIYEDEINSVLSELDSGKFEVYMDSTHNEHKISEYGNNIILNSIQGLS